MPLSVRYALWCKFLFLGVENQPLGVVFRVVVWVRARFGGLMVGCGGGELPSVDGSWGGVIVPIVYSSMCPCCWGVGLCFWCGIDERFVHHLLSVV